MTSFSFFRNRGERETFPPAVWLVFAGITVLTVLLCVCTGSVNVPLRQTLRIIRGALAGRPASGAGSYRSIILSVRLPRVFCVALTGLRSPCAAQPCRAF